MPEVFVNTTPLQYLHRLGRLEWLRNFYGRVAVPAAVATELDEGLRLGAKVPDVRTIPWVEVRDVPEAAEVFPNFIHRGEAGVIALARLSGDALILMDDGLARPHARGLGALPAPLRPAHHRAPPRARARVEAEHHPQAPEPRAPTRAGSGCESPALWA